MSKLFFGFFLGRIFYVVSLIVNFLYKYTIMRSKDQESITEAYLKIFLKENENIGDWK